MKSGKTVARKLLALTMRTLPLMLTCAELDSFLVDYLDGTLAKPQSRKFRIHLRLCRDCRRYLEGYERSIALSQTAFNDPNGLPEDLPDELLKAILAAREDP